MPIKYVQTLGSVAGIPQTVAEVQITCAKPAVVALSASTRPAVALSCAKPAPLALTARPTLNPDYGGD